MGTTGSRYRSVDSSSSLIKLGIGKMGNLLICFFEEMIDLLICSIYTLLRSTSIYMLGFMNENWERYGISSFCLCLSSVMSVIIHTQKKLVLSSMHMLIYIVAQLISSFQDPCKEK